MNSYCEKKTTTLWFGMGEEKKTTEVSKFEFADEMFHGF